jgi:CubicO group peptidase (beta-lactamase class C family)
MKKSVSAFLFLIIVLSIAAPVFSQQNSSKPKLDSLLNLLGENDKFMGSVAIMENGIIAYSKATGYADLESKTLATPSTIYRVGSVSKMFTSAMIYQLADEKKISLEAKLANYFPGIPNAGNITILDMLLHRSGLWSVTDDSLYLDWCVNYKSREEIVSMISTHPVLFQPGEKSEYSNSNYILLGFILEDITGKDYATNLNERIANKVNLNYTYYGGKINIGKSESHSYSWSAEGWKKENETDMSIPHGAGAVVSTSEDLVKFGTALFNNEIISKASLENMIKTEGTYGKGIFPMPFYELKGYGHTGGIDGFRSVLIVFPEKKLCLAVTSNGLNYGQNDILIGLLSIYLGREYELPDFSVAAVSVDVLKSYEGTYSSESFPLKLTIKVDGNTLTAQGTGQSAFPLDPVSETEFRFDAAGIRITFPETGKLNIKQGGMDILMNRE